MAAETAAYPSVPVAKKARGTAHRERRVGLERFMERKTEENDWTDFVLELNKLNRYLIALRFSLLRMT
jgi:hypothetical protein